MNVDMNGDIEAPMRHTVQVVNIDNPLRSLCDQLGLDYTMVSELRVTPVSVIATVIRDEDGSA